MCCLAFWCEPLALGQVMTRMRLNPFASKTQGGAYCTAFKVLALVYFVYLAIDQALTTIIAPYTLDIDEEGNIVAPDFIPQWALVVKSVHNMLSFLFFVYMLVVLIRTRAYVRPGMRRLLLWLLVLLLYRYANGSSYS
jgi:hypothetical protein